MTPRADSYEVLVELLALLPAPGAPFPIEARAAWLRVAVAVFDTVYGPADRRILIELEAAAARPHV